MPETTNDQWIWELEERIYAMTDELCNKNHVIEIAPYINKDVIEEKEEVKKDNYDFYRPFDTKVIEADGHWFLKLEAALAAM